MAAVCPPPPSLCNTLSALQEGGGEAAVARRRVLAAWQHALPHLGPRYADDAVCDAFVTRARRVLLLTSGHIVYCKAKRLEGSEARYRVRWHVPLPHVNNVLCAPLPQLEPDLFC